MAGWDPFLVLGLDHDPHLSWWRVWRGYRARLRWTWRIGDDYRRSAEARRVMVAYRAVRTGAQRRQVLTDLAVDPDAWWGFYVHTDVRELVEAVMPPLLGGPYEWMEACDLRALEREAAALRLERAAAGVTPWPRTRLGRTWARARHG